MWTSVLSFLVCLCLNRHLDSWCKRKITGEEKFFSHKCLFDTRGLSVKRKHMQYFLYDRYFVNFPSLFLNGFIIFFLWVLEFWGEFGDFVCLFMRCAVCFVLFCWNHFAEEGMEGRKMSMEIMLSSCINFSCCIGQLLLNWDQSESIWRT